MSSEKRSALVQKMLQQLGKMLSGIGEKGLWPVKIKEQEFRKMLSLEISFLLAFALTGGKKSGITQNSSLFFGEVYYEDEPADRQLQLGADALTSLIDTIDLKEIHEATPPYLAVFIDLDRQYETHYARHVVSRIAAICLSAISLEVESEKMTWLYTYLDHLNKVLDEQGLARLDEVKQDKQSGVERKVLPRQLRTVEQCQQVMDDLVGLTQVKKEFRQWFETIEVIKIEQAQGKNAVIDWHHFVFSGVPGTGRTTVAQLIGQGLVDLHELSSGHVVKVEGSVLCGSDMEQTLQRIRMLFQEAQGGILYINHGEQLLEDGPFCREALAILIKLSLKYQQNWLLILAISAEAGFHLKQLQPSLKTKPFIWWDFPPFSTFELVQLFDRLCHKQHLRLESMAEHRLEAWCHTLTKEHRSSAKAVEWLFEQTTNRQKARIQGLRWLTQEEEYTLCAQDFPSIVDWTKIQN